MAGTSLVVWESVMQTELKHARPCVRILCRKCYSIAKLKVIEPLMFIDGICEAVYQCEKCGTIRKRRLSSERPATVAGKMPDQSKIAG